MSVINHKYEYIFMHCPHTGGRSIEVALMEHEGSRNFNGHHHITTAAMFELGWVTHQQFETYKKFRVVRDPHDWLVTCWLRNDRQGMPFHKWVTKAGLNFMQQHTLFWRYEEADYTLKCEDNLLDRLNDYLNGVCAAPAIDVLPHIGKTESKPDWRDLLTVSQAEQLEDLYPDIYLYGYGVFK